MMRLPNSLEVRGGGKFPSAYDFCPGKLKVGEPRESKATKISKNPQEILKSILSVIIPGSG